MIDIYLTISTITLNVDGLNVTIKRQKFWVDKKTRINYSCVWETHFNCKGPYTSKLKAKR